MAKRTFEINLKDSIGKDEVYCHWYRCPRCGEVHITSWYKHCPDCGVKILTTGEEPY